MRAMLFIGLLVGSQLGLAEDRGLEGPPKAGIDWVRLPGGSFLMGAPEGVGEVNEHPQRRVTVRAFELSKTEVTVAQYAACVQAGACAAGGLARYPQCNWAKPERADHPINCVDWHQARVFAAWAGGRLPTEAEWEYAARSGGQEQTYPWGDEEASCRQTVMAGEGGDGCGEGLTWPVCSKPLGNSAQGVCDLAGSVWEWVEDERCGYAQAPVDGSAASCDRFSRVLRGGGWGSPATNLQATNRRPSPPGDRSHEIGFRIARSVHP